MSQIWFKIYSPELSETRMLWMYVPPGNEVEVYEPLKCDVRHVFKLDDDYEFYFTYTDNDKDEITIKENYEIVNCLFRMENNDKLKLTITSTEQQKIPHQSDDNSSTALFSDSFQSIMKHFEIGMSTLQATVEKSTSSTVDTVVKTAAETAAQVYRSMLPPANLSEQPKFDVICDGCYTPIRGQRWRCENCDDFDLCSPCKSRINHDPAHLFRFMKNEFSQQTLKEDIVLEQVKAASCHSEPSHTIFVCDFCDSDIVGIRHTCGACPDFDLCHSCFAIVKENHPDHHFITHLVGTQEMKGRKGSKQMKSRKLMSTFSPRSTPDTMDQVVYHRGVECDNCEASITGIRYKCGHCANYDLCGTFEEFALSLHDNTHAFIKIRYPIQSIARKPILPSFSPLTFMKSDEKKEMEMAPPATVPNNDNNSSSDSFISKPEEITAANSIPLPATPPSVDNIMQSMLSVAFISDINIPDGTVVAPKKTFIKMWKIVNNGNIDWPIGTHLLFNGGSILRPYPISRADSFVVPSMSPNEETVITAELQAPDCSGEYSSYFCLCTPEGIRFGDSLWCTIKVAQDDIDNNEKSPNTAADIMMNSNHSMIFPVLSTTSVTHVSDDHKSESNYGYTDNDDYSEFTQHSRVSPLSSDLTQGFSESHQSSPTPSELDIGESRNNMYSNDDEFKEEEDEQEYVNHLDQVFIPTSDSQHIATSTASLADEDDEFVIVDGSERDDDEEEDENVELVSSIQSSRTVTSMKTSPEEFIYQAQLTQLHEMGFTSYDNLAISLLEANKGTIENVVAKLLEYP